MATSVMGISNSIASSAAPRLDVDKDDLERYSEFVNHKLYDLLVIGEAHASDNRRDVVEPSDLPITKGLQESIHRFRGLDEEVELRPILEQLAMLPQLDRPLAEATEARLPEIVGGLSLALARTFTIVEREVEPQLRALGTSVPDLRPPAVGGPAGAAGDADTLEVDFGDDSSADQSFDLSGSRRRQSRRCTCTSCSSSHLPRTRHVQRAHHGFDDRSSTSSLVSRTTARRAAQPVGRGELVVVDDVAHSPVFVGTSGLDVMLEDGARAVESMRYLNLTPARSPASSRCTAACLAVARSGSSCWSA